MARRRWYHTGQEVFVNDELRWEKATVIHDQNRKTLVVKARENGSRNLAERLTMTEVESTGVEKIGRERHRSFTGTDSQLGALHVTIVKADCGCSS